MGTRSVTFVYDEKHEPIINLYRQYDGYPSGHGTELAEFLNRIEEITNGIRGGETRVTANGMGCLAAQLVANFKTEVGEFYLYPVNNTDCGQEYEYHVFKDRVVVKNCNINKEIFNGTWANFLNFCATKATV